MSGITGLGILCPKCSAPNTSIVDSRPSVDSTRRRRECGKCGNRFTTYEVLYDGRTDQMRVRLLAYLAVLEDQMGHAASNIRELRVAFERTDAAAGEDTQS